MASFETPCPSCGKQISYTVSKCGHCGYKITQADIEARRQSGGEAGWQLGCLAGIVLAAFFFWLLFFRDSESERGGASETAKIVVARDAVRERLRDPSSAEFRNEKIGSYQGAEVVCGEVNSANGFGGMSGYQRYISNAGAATVLEEQMEPTEFAKTWAGVGC
jgi:hypothetical protein